MIIVVEGIDRVGKTTLCNMISKRFSIPIFKEGLANVEEHMWALNLKDANYGSMKSIVNFAVQSNASILLDRFHWSEYTYGMLERHYINQYCLKIEQMLERLENVIIVLVEPIDIDHSSKEHGSPLYQHDAVFNSLYENSKLDKIRCCYNTLESVCEKIERKLADEKRANSINI